MNAKKEPLQESFNSDLARVDAHVIAETEYDELPELTEDMLARATLKKGGRPRLENPKKSISLRLSVDVLEKWRATGPGWQTRMAQRLAEIS
ncbi:MAG: BrnA antitoxin family protein [Janthinobacterium lividum]